MNAFLSKLVALFAPSLYKFLWNKGKVLLKTALDWIYKNTIQKWEDKKASQKFDEQVKDPNSTRDERRKNEDDFINS